MNARLIGVTAGLILAVLGTGVISPPRAHANDTGKILLGVAAGVAIAGLLDSSRDCHHRDRVYVYPRPYPAPAWRYGPRVYAAPPAVVVVPQGRYGQGRWVGDSGHCRR